MKNKAATPPPGIDLTQPIAVTLPGTPETANLEVVHLGLPYGQVRCFVLHMIGQKPDQLRQLSNTTFAVIDSTGQPRTLGIGAFMRILGRDPMLCQPANWLN